VCSNFIQVCRPKSDNDPRFVFYLLDHLYRTGITLQFQQQTTGLMNLKLVDFLQVPISRPSKEAQRVIALVLETVDRVIDQTQALLLKQRRIKRGLMHDLLTQGVDSKGQLRDPATHKYEPSRLGLIPSEWNLTSLERLSMFVTSGPRGWARYYADQGAKFIRIGNLTRQHVNFRLQDMQHVKPPDGAEGNRTQLKAGDVLISITADLGSR
jgi:type I restriction enzyme, S subunit